MTVAAGGTWTITGDSSLKTLTIEDGGAVSVPNGCEMTIYTGCDNSNSLTFYDESTGTEVTELTAGTYENVVIRVTGTPIVEEEILEDSAPEEEEGVRIETEPISIEEPAETVSEETVPVEEPVAAAEATSAPILPIVIVIVVIAAVVVVVVIVKKKK